MSLYHEAAEFLTSTPSEGGSLKGRVFKRKSLKSPPNQLYALVLETAKWSGVLKEVVGNTELLKHERKVSDEAATRDSSNANDAQLKPPLALLLVHDLLLSKGGVALPQSHGLRQSIERHKGRLSSELTRARLRKKAPTIESLREQVNRESAGEEANYPRWVRVNTLKSSVEDQLETTFSTFKQTNSLQKVIGIGGKHVLIDPHVPNLLAVTQGADLTKTEAYTSGKIILQDKASCFPAYLLDPRIETGDVVDACAAPGNKTTHLAAILDSHQSEFETPAQSIYAFEKDSRRARTLEKMVTTAGSRKTTKIGLGQDFLQVDPQDERYANVGGLLLDPSCSGSGIVGRDSMPEVYLPEPYDASKKAVPKTGQGSSKKRKHKEVEAAPQNVMIDDEGNETIIDSDKDLKARLDALSGFQLTLLLHAFKFPAAERITYSTCSIHAEENEAVVMKALASNVARRCGWKILRRDAQVTGMREWPVRGVPEYCNGDTEVAEGCIRSYKDDGRGVMGFFVAGFVRCKTNTTEDEGPYLRDDDGRIVRDQAGMPVLKSTGEAVVLQPKTQPKEEQPDASPSNDSSDDVSSASSDSRDEWAGFGD